MSLTEEDARKIAHAIAFGHAYWKHVANANECGEVIHNPLDPDLRTAYWPAEGRHEFESLR